MFITIVKTQEKSPKNRISVPQCLNPLNMLFTIKEDILKLTVECNSFKQTKVRGKIDSVRI